jgi:transcriptional regulator with XRE-family HTH domain
MTISDWIESNPLRLWRRAHNLSYERAARRLALSARTLWNLERGRAKPQPNTLNTLAIGLEVNYQRFTEDWDDWLAMRPE